MYGYIYKTTNNVNGTIYVGKHKGEFDFNYKGSGKYLTNAINKYGADNFTVEMIECCEDLSALNAREIYWIHWYRNIGCKMYNISSGGDGGDTFAGLSDEDRKLRIEYLRKYSYFSNLSIEEITSLRKKAWETRRRNGNDKFSQKHRQHLRQSHKGVKPSQASIQKRVASRRGYHPSEETKQKIRESNLGKKRSSETCQAISESRRGKCQGTQNPFYGKKHSEEVRKLISKLNSEGVCGGKGTIWVNNGKTNKRIFPNELDIYQSNGYQLGRISWK